MSYLSIERSTSRLEKLIWLTLWTATVVAAGSAVTVCGATPAPEFRFDRVSLAEGLSQVSVYCLLEDGLGFLWVGGEYGLNRYDGYGFRTYVHAPGQPASLSGNQVRALATDATGDLWVGTFGSGINRWDPETGLFTRLRHDPGDPASLASDSVRALAVGADGSLWVGTDAGLDRLQQPAGADPVFIHHRRLAGQAGSLIDDSVRSLHVDGAGRLWIGTDAGLDRLDPGAGTFVHYPVRPGDHDEPDAQVRCLADERRGRLWVGTSTAGLSLLDPSTGWVSSYRSDPNDPSTLSGDSVNAVHQDESGKVWVATEAWGLNRLDPETGAVVRYPTDSDDQRSTSCRHLNALLEDSSENLWIGTTFGGLNRLDLKGTPFTVYTRDPTAALGLQSNVVFAVLADSEDVLWVGTEGGVDRIDPKAGIAEHFAARPDGSGPLWRGPSYALLEDRHGGIWAGTWGGGLVRFDPSRRQFTAYRHRPGDPDSLVHDVVLALLEDRKGRLWVGTLDGLDILDPTGERFLHFSARRDVAKELAGAHVKCLHQDSSGAVWIGTIGGGLMQYDETGEGITAYRHNPRDPRSLSDDNVASVMQSSSGEIWVGTAGGLNRLDPTTGTFTSIRVADGLPSDAITGALEDDDGRIWVAHFAGLSRFDPATGEILNLDAGDGLPANEFNSGAYCRGAGGTMFFGGVGGLVAFDPGTVSANPFPPRVVITSFRVYGEVVDLGRSPWLVSEIVLDHDQDFIAFEFVGLELTAPDQISYEHYLEGFDRGWVSNGSRRFASYTNLAPGDYTFRVKGANGAGVWGEQTRIRVIMNPPFWQTWWFRAGGGLTILLALATAYAWRTSALRTKIAEQERVERVIRESRDELRRANLELEGYSTGLESMVEERTQQLEAVNRELHALAISDALTGVANRRRFEEVVDAEWRRAVRFARPLSILMADIDHFKPFNDALGHQAGDECLRRVASALAELLNRPGEVLARYGGEEFVAVLPETDLEAAAHLAESMRRAVEALAVPHPGSHLSGVVTVSVGAATVTPVEHARWTSLVEVADRALYAAKAAGRNRVETAPPVE